MDRPPVLWEAMAPPEARPAAQEACRQLVELLERVSGALLLTGGLSQPKDEQSFGLGAVVQIGAELARGLITLADAQQSYGAAALLRQLVEVEYLAWALAENPDEVSRWIRADHHERRRFFSPQRLRDQNEDFRDEEYWAHCERGGHPHPHGMMFLPVPQVLGAGRWQRGRGVGEVWDDFVFHLVAIWRHLLSAMDGHPLGDRLADTVVGPAEAAITRWQTVATEARAKRARPFGDQEG